ncbi:MAG: helix-turn-helix transcriptional regulator [Armatimonadetes bacterium]|nr:helix-turn-helix transcriptional regulator [Armatimonadota bacterium]
MPTDKDDLGLPAAHDGLVWHYAFAGLRHLPHHHDELEINLVTQGKAAYLLGDRRYDLRRNTLVWLFPAQEHVLLDQSPDHGMWIGVFTPSLLHRVCTTPETRALCEADPAGWYCKPLPEEDARQLEALLREIAEAREDTARHNAGLGYAVLSAWAAYGRAGDAPGGADVHPAVECAVRLLRGADAPETLAALALRVGLSASRLSRLFRQQTGVSLADFRNAQRLERFLRLWGRGRRLSVLEAALEAGFGSYPQFHRVFTRRMGCSPAEYRRRQET